MLPNERPTDRRLENGRKRLNVARDTPNYITRQIEPKLRETFNWQGIDNSERYLRDRVTSN